MKKINQKGVGSFYSLIFSKEGFLLFVLIFILLGSLWGFYISKSLFLIFISMIVSIFLAFLAEKFYVLYTRRDQESSAEKQGLYALLASLEDAVIIYSPKFEILYMNPATEKIFNISAEKYIRTIIRPEISSNQELRTLTQAIFPSLASSVLQISEVNEWPQVVDILIDNPEKKFHTTLIRISNAVDRALFFIKIIRDETRERAILRNKNEFINTAAHQLRTPLTALHWALESIKEMTKDASQDVYAIAEEALNVSERALKITNDLLDVAKIEEGKFGYKFTSCELVGFINEILETLKIVATQKNITLSFDHETIETIEAPRVDRERLGMALFNLVDNALKYTLPNGTVKVSLSKEGPYAYITVADSGVGIAEEDIQKLFKKFFRGSSAAQLEPNGSGLGLFITKNIIERHGGKISVSSQINRGTTFKFSIPLETTLVPEFERNITYEEEL